MKNKGRYIAAVVFGVLTVIWIILVRAVDVQAIGPENTSIGLSHLNQYIFDSLGVNMTWYKVTQGLGVLAILIALLFVLAGVLQFIKKKSVAKINKDLLALYGLYVLVICVYILFEAVIVNYRPIIMPDALHPEASFPSSHTMLVCVVMGSAAAFVGRHFKRKPLCGVLKIVCVVIIAITVIGRLLSGVHWFSDIIGGILISLTLLSLYLGFTKKRRNLSQRERSLKKKGA
ncbi:MAG: phosphatase PAP2 family protein [Clostridia bacterium]|nr:phosphatase PAP2 family protein [Clostridia bacterium]